MGVFVLLLSNINTIHQNSLSAPLMFNQNANLPVFSLVTYAGLLQFSLLKAFKPSTQYPVFKKKKTVKAGTHQADFKELVATN